MIDERPVVEAYRLLLNRKPESANAIAPKSKLETVDALVHIIAMSNEFLFAHRSALLRHLHPRPVPGGTPLPVPASLPSAKFVGHADD